jgi:hypothetical protein
MIMDNQKCYKTNMTRLHWTAIFAGALVGVGLGFLLNMFSMAIGLSAYTTTSTHTTAIAVGGVLGILIGVIVTMGVAGFVAGYLGRFYNCYCHGGVIHGFITWTLVLMLSALLIGSINRYVSFYEENLDPALVPSQISTANTPASNVTADVTAEQPNAPEQAIDENPKHLAWSGWILFISFFLGAFSSCIGACYGMRCKKEESIPLQDTPKY